MRKYLLFLLLLSPYFVHAQDFGGNPPSIKWMQIKTDSLQVIYPKGSKSKALQVLHTSLYVNRHERYSIGNKVQKFTILLQNNTVTSNGFVALGPFRAVFQTTPPSDNYSLGANNWLNELSIHETWHALQNMNFKTGIGKTFHTLFGGNGQSFITSLLIPDWYWEGDAVFMETKLTDQGRGRLPSFMEPFKSLYYAGKDYSYAKIRNGSLRDMTPNKYPLGYMMTSYVRNHYGNDFWKDVLQETLLNKKVINRQNKKHPQKPFHLFKYGFYPLDAALKYNIGTGIKGLYRNAHSHYQKEWNSERSSFKISQADTLKRNSSKTVLSYRYPHVMEDGSILTVKSGYAKNPEIIRIDTSGKEHPIVQMGNIQSQYFSYNGDKIVWAAYRPDLRWSWKSYSIIRIHNLQNGKTQTLSHRSRYFSPALSEDGKQIIVTQVLPGGKSQLVLLNADNGNRIKTLPNPNHYFYTYPIFGNTKNIVFSGARDTLGKMSIVKINLTNEKETSIISFAPKSIGPLVNSSDYLYFSAAYTERIQLYALHKKDQQLFQIAKRPLGDYSLSYDSLYHRIIAGEYTAKGYQLIAFPNDKSRWNQISPKQEQKIFNPYVPKALTYDNTGSIQEKISKQDHPAKRYHAIDHLFKLHSWSFQSLYPEVGLYLQSRDLLGTLQVNAGGGYNLNEKTPFIEAYTLYGGLFPYIQAGIRETFDRQDYVNDTIPIQWNERNWYAGFKIPLNISGSLYQRLLTLTGDYHQSNLKFKEAKYQNRHIHYVSTGLSFSNYRYMPVQALNPKFGQSLSLQYEKTVDKRDAFQLTSNLNLYFPGFFKNHSFYLTSAYSVKYKSNEYKFSDDYSYALGYNSLPYKNIYTLGINYQLPIAYPDWGLSWVYLLRIRLHLFYDYSHANMIPGLNMKKGTFRSTGASVYFDTKIFGSLSVPIGFQVAYLLDTDFKDPGRNTVFNISFPVNLF